MSKLNRRECLQGMLATMAVAGISPASPTSAAGAGSNSKEPGIKLALVWGVNQMHQIRLARQMGVTHSIAGVAGALSKVPRSQYVDTLAKIKAEYDAAGMTIAGVESHPVPAEKIKLGLPGRDEEIENYCAAIEALSKVGIHMVCYDFMAGIDWYRTKTNYPGRGGALSLEFDYREAEKLGPTQWGQISEEKMWDSLEYFHKAVIPVAEKAGVKMALHPDDPPISPLRGISRILISAANYRRAMNIVPSPINGVTFDHSIFYLMGENIQALAREWCREKKIFFIHSRNLTGTREHFLETFHDNGSINFREMYRTYYESGFDGPIRPDHAPTMDGEPNDHPGYEILGKIFAIGYIKGIMAGQNIPYA